MACVAPLGPVYQAGTLSGNPLATAAGLAGLELLDDAAYRALTATAERLAEHLRSAFAAAGIPAVMPQVASLVGLHFGEEEPVDYPSAQGTDTARYAAFFHAMLDRGVALAPGAYEVLFPGLAHTDDVIDEIGEAARDAALAIAA
jgi:glutamate-1-semialdehyde 2,1-aminomutase